MTRTKGDTVNDNGGAHALTLRDVLPSDSAAVLALHTLVFGPEVDQRWFEWKYGAVAGQGQAVGAWQNGELIAYCGGLPRTLWRDGRSVRGLQMGDVMVHPAWRGILRRRGPFFHVTQRFHSSRLGAAPERAHQLGFGFPNERHLQLGAKLGLMRDGGAIEALHWDAPAPRLPWHWRWRELRPADERFDAAVNTAWQAMLARSGNLLLGQRDAAYLRWRYVGRPGAAGTAANAPPHYRFFELGRAWSGTATGVAVLDLRSSSALWLDWIGPVELMPLASQACRRQAAQAGAAELMAWASAAVVQQLALSSISRSEVCAGLAVSAFSDLQAQEVPHLRWWLMGGDTDFL